jgi:surface antigen
VAGLIIRDIIFRSISKNKNNMLKLPTKSNITSFKADQPKFRRRATVLSLAVLLLLGTVPTLVHAASCSTAASCQAQINNLSGQTSSDQQAVGSLESQAQSYQSTIASLSSQISTIQSAISSNEAKQASLEQQITADQTEITQKKSTLSDDITTMYVNGQMTTIEELATSKNLSDYADRQEYQTVVQDQLSDMVQQITTLENQLQASKTQVDQLVTTEQAQNSQLASANAQEQSLLNYDQAQQASYNSQISSNSSSISALKSALAALNSAGTLSISTSGHGGYPASTPSLTSPGTTWGYDEPQDNTSDNWRMDNRECVSYTAFIASTKYGVNTSGWGNAYQWIAAAENAGFTVDSTPSVGAIAIRNRDYSEPGDVGHAMYVVGVGSGTITVDEYNEHYDGTFDQRTFDPSSYDSRGGIYYIHFN